MNFLIILMAILMVHQRAWIRHFQHDAWFVQVWQRGVAAMVRSQYARLSLFLIVGVPVVVLTLGLFFLNDYGWGVSAINAVVLLYAIGRGSWRDECQSWVDFFSEKDSLVLKQKIAEQAGVPADAAENQIENTWLQARSDVLYHQLDGFYTVVFWFFMAGAPAALLYRLLRLYQQQQAAGKNNGREDEYSEVGRLLWLMEWLPVRMMAMLFCLVGNFTTGFWVLKQILLDGVLTSTSTLARCADAALFLDGSVDDDELLDDAAEQKKTRTEKMIERMEAKSLAQKTLSVMRRNSVELQALLERSEWAFLVLLAVTTLL